MKFRTYRTSEYQLTFDVHLIHNVFKEGKQMPSTQGRPRKYNFDLDYFEEINTPEKAYWLGVLYADGSINSIHTSVTLSSIDKILIRNLKSALGRTSPIKSIPAKGMHKQRFYIHLCSKKMVSDLVKQGCTSRKTFEIKPPSIAPDLVRHFIRGLWDGDGTVLKDGSQASVAGTEDLLKWVRQMLNQSIDLPLRKVRKKPGCYVLDYSGSLVLDRLRTYLYTDATVFLPRKRKRFFTGVVKNPNHKYYERKKLYTNGWKRISIP